MSEDNFADAPLSVAEIRSERNSNGADWGPRDALIHTLRLIDLGKLNPVGMVIALSEEVDPDGAIATTFINATPNPVIAYGLLVDTILKLARSERPMEAAR